MLCTFVRIHVQLLVATNVVARYIDQQTLSVGNPGIFTNKYFVIIGRQCTALHVLGMCGQRPPCAPAIRVLFAFVQLFYFPCFHEYHFRRIHQSSWSGLLVERSSLDKVYWFSEGLHQL